MTLRLRASQLVRVLTVLGGIALLAYAARRSALVTFTVATTMFGLALATRRGKVRSRNKALSTHIGIVSALTLLSWASIATAFRVADSLDPESVAVSFAGELTLGTIASVTVLTVGALSAMWSALASERSRRRKHRRSPGQSAGKDLSTGGSA